MAERERGFFSRFRRSRASQEDVNELAKIINQNQPEWDGKDLASLSRIGMATNVTRKNSTGDDTHVSYHLLREISQKSEVVNAIIRRAVDDTLANGYQFVLADGKEKGDQQQLEKVRQFFQNPNPDDMGDEWLESLLFDLILFGDAYLEMDGSNDRVSEDGKEWNYDGELLAVWPIPAETMKIIPANQTPKPPKMAFVQSINKEKRKFDANKVIHIAKFKQGRSYGSSPLIPLLEVIAGQLNLSNYLNMLYTGTLPKTILNVGDISNGEMKAMLGLIEQQLAGGKSPFGLIAINGGSGFNMHRLIDSTREGAQLDLLYYYREEICAVFGIPPMKLGWVQTGKLANPEQQLDAWYDVVESYHSRLSSMINNKVLPRLGITDWKWKFVSIRPSRETERAETLKAQANAVATLRQEGAITINEAREILGLEVIEDERASDPFFVSPKLSINQPQGVVENNNEDSVLAGMFPSPLDSEIEEDIGEMPIFTSGSLDDEKQLALFQHKREEDAETFLKLEDDLQAKLELEYEANQKEFADRYIGALSERFRPNEVIEFGLDSQMMRTKVVGSDDLAFSIDLLDRELIELLDKQTISTTTTLTAGFDETLAALAAGTGVQIAFDTPDAEALAYWARKWQLPALRNTLGAHRAAIISVFERANNERESWDWVARRMRDTIDPSGSAYPRYYYTRIARTEPRRIVENAHLSGLKKLGFEQVQRLVTVDDVTDKDVCVPFENAVYPLDKSGGVLPAHPNCRCTFVPYIPTDQETPQTPVDDSDILKPDVEGAEIIGLD